MTHKRIHRFQVDGVLRDDSDFIRARNQFENVLILNMRTSGYVRVLDIDPMFSVEFIQETSNYNFILTVHGIYVGKAKAWDIEGILQGKLIHRYTHLPKLNQYSKQSA